MPHKHYPITLDTSSPDVSALEDPMIPQSSYGENYSVIRRSELRTAWEIMVRAQAACTMAARIEDETYDSCRQCPHGHDNVDMRTWESSGLECIAAVTDFDDCHLLNWADIESEVASVLMEMLSVDESALDGMWTRKHVQEVAA